MKTKVINYENLFNLFVLKIKQDNRDLLKHPFKQKDRYYATDAQSLIYMSVKKIKLPFSEQKQPECFRVIPKQTVKLAIPVFILKEKLSLKRIREPGGKVFDNKIPFSIYGTIYYYNQLIRLLKAAKITDTDTIYQMSEIKEGANIFKLNNGISVLVAYAIPKLTEEPIKII